MLGALPVQLTNQPSFFCLRQLIGKFSFAIRLLPPGKTALSYRRGEHSTTMLSSAKMVIEGRMTGEGRKCRKKGDVLVVGLKLNLTSRELLTWILAKFADPGDRVIAIHVATSFPDPVMSTSKQETTIQQVKGFFNSIIGVYEGLCRIRRVDLLVKVKNGTSIRKVLVEESKAYGATKLVLGTTRKQLTLGSPFPLTKYFSKRLSATCSVLVIQHGKVMFEREGSLPGIYGSVPNIMRSYSCNVPSQNLLEGRSIVLGGSFDSPLPILESGCPDMAQIDAENSSSSCSHSKTKLNSQVNVLLTQKSISPEVQRSRPCLPRRKNFCTLHSRDGIECEVNDKALEIISPPFKINKTPWHTSEIKNSEMRAVQFCPKVSSTEEFYPHQSVNPSRPQEYRQQPAFTECTAKSQGEGEDSLKRFFMRMNCQEKSTALVHPKLQATAISEESLSNIVAKISNPGWPLLHQSISFSKMSCQQQIRARQMSVVEWALQLPNRHEEICKKFQDESLHSTHISCQYQDHLEHHALSNDLTSCNLESGRQTISDSSIVHELQIEKNQEIIQSRLSWEDAVNHFQVDNQPSLVKKLGSSCQNQSCIRFSFEELEAATCNFSAEKLIGKGGCSWVYQGVLTDGNVVAVKCLNPSATDADGDLLLEVEITSSLRHPYIINLIGYCVGIQHHLLVYNFVSNGTLEQSLHGGKGKPVLPWKVRYEVAIKVAEALNYLHDGCSRPIIHMDVKSSNILLSDDFKPQLADFGLAKWAPTSSLHITCNDVVGTFGYLAPEYFRYGKVNEKTDVYSFGVVLLELITGRKPIDISKPKGQENVVMWARPMLEEDTCLELVDPNLEGVYNVFQIKNVMLAAALCLRQSAQSRPPIRHILKLICAENEEPGKWAKHELTTFKQIDEGYDIPYLENSDIHKHITLAFLGLDDDVASESGTDQSLDFAHSSMCLEEYFQGRYSRSSSFDCVK